MAAKTARTMEPFAVLVRRKHLGQLFHRTTESMFKKKQKRGLGGTLLPLSV